MGGIELSANQFLPITDSILAWKVMRVGFARGPAAAFAPPQRFRRGEQKLGGRALQVPCQMMWRRCDGYVCRVPLWFCISWAKLRDCETIANVDKDATRGEGWEKPPCNIFAATRMLQKCCRKKLQHFCNIPATFFLGDSMLQHSCNIPATFLQHCTCNKKEVALQQNVCCRRRARKQNGNVAMICVDHEAAPSCKLPASSSIL